MAKTNSDPLLKAKKAAGQAAVEFIQDGMLVGLGTGSTTFYFIEALSKKCQEGLKILAVATSKQSTRQAQQLKIPLKDPATITYLDITVDGADEIDSHKNMIKGGGGALFREKLLAQSSREMIVIIDETKLVKHLGKHPLPVEIAYFVYRSTVQRLQDKGYQIILRLHPDNTLFMTDNGNCIVDIQYQTPILNLAQEQESLKSIPGVIETGLFFNVAGRVVMGYENGSIKLF